MLYNFRYEPDGLVFQASFALTFRDCDLHRQMKLSAVLGIAGDVAGMAYAVAGLPYETLLAARTVFLLSRYSVRFLRPAMEGELITVHTWERGAEGVHVLRDYEYLGEDGQPRLYITSAWVIVDPVTRRPLRPSAFTAREIHSSERRLDCPDTRRLRPAGESTPLGQRPVYFSDLDGNGHFTNGKYGDVAADFLPEEYRARTVTGFEINFTREARPGDVLELSGYPEDGGFMMEGTHGEAEGFVCRYAFGCSSTRRQDAGK